MARLLHTLAGVVLVGLLVLPASCSRQPARETRTGFALGTAVSVTVYGRASERVYRAVFDRIREIEAKMSVNEANWESTELLEVIRGAGRRPVTVSADTFAVVQAALGYARLTDGAFDPTVYPLVQLWGIGTDLAAVPTREAVETAIAATDYRAVELDPATRSVYLPVEGMGIDVGGIAKGYAADEAARILREAGVRHALIDLGGNILTVGDKPGSSPWRIGIQVPDPGVGRGSFLGIAEVIDLSVVTSGTYERYFVEDGALYHHILDPATGFPASNDLESVTILTAESMRADALSTAVFVMGLEAGIALVERLDGVEALLVTSDGEVHASSGALALFTLTDDRYTVAEQ